MRFDALLVTHACLTITWRWDKMPSDGSHAALPRAVSHRIYFCMGFSLLGPHDISRYMNKYHECHDIAKYALQQNDIITVIVVFMGNDRRLSPQFSGVAYFHLIWIFISGMRWLFPRDDCCWDMGIPSPPSYLAARLTIPLASLYILSIDVDLNAWSSILFW